MTDAWAAERELTAEQAKALIDEQFPELSPSRVVPISRGWDNAAFRVNDDLVFRFPRRQLGAACMENEINVLPSIADTLTLPIPKPLFVGKPSGDYPWSFAGYRFLLGETACSRSLTDGQRAEMAQALAAFLQRLHSVSREQACSFGTMPDIYGRLDLATRIPQTRARLQQIQEAGLVEDVGPLMRIVDQTEARFGLKQFASGPDSVLLHGDLYIRHLLIDEGGALCGVIDWGDVHYGVPATDLMIAHTFLPPQAHQAFRKGYGLIDEDTWQLSRFRALNHTTATLPYAASVEDDNLLRETRQAVAYLVCAC